MSCAVIVKGRDGIVLASDSRRTYTTDGLNSQEDHEYLSWDGDIKVFPLARAPHNYVAAALFGSPSDVFGSTQDFLAEISAALPPSRRTVAEYALHVSAALVRRAELPARWPFRPVLLVAGYDEDGTSRVVTIETPNFVPVEQHVNGLGITYGGMRQYIDLLLHGFDSRLVVPEQSDLYTRLALDTMSLPDCADLAKFLVHTTVEMVRFCGQYGLQAAGGPIDLARITAERGFEYLALKEPDRRIKHRRFVSAAPFPVINAPEGIGHAATYTIMGDPREPTGKCAE